MHVKFIVENLKTRENIDAARCACVYAAKKTYDYFYIKYPPDKGFHISSRFVGQNGR